MVKRSFIDNQAISNIIFYPRKTPIPTNLDSNIKILKFNIKKDVLIGGFFYLNDSNLPTILLFHGNGEIAADYQQFSDFFFDCGVNLAVADFRGYGFSSGDPTYSSLITDALPIYNEFNKWMIDNNIEDSLFVLGRSLGSVCASEIGAHNPESLHGIIFESGFASIYNMMTRLFRISGPNITPESLNEYSNDIRIKKINYDFNNQDSVIKIVKVINKKKTQVDLDKAKIIVAGGRGVGSKDGFKILKELAEILGAELAGSRITVELKWLDAERQVGQTGQTVSPKLYVACGISGAIQHVVGMQNADIIVAINKDPNAPIFNIAHYGIVGNLHEIIPVLIGELNKIKTES